MLSLSITLQTYGFDLSYYQGAVSQSSFSCLKSNGYNFAIFQAQIGSTISSYAPSDYKNAKNAGIQYIDFYIFPTTAKDPRAQVRDTINYLQGQGVLSGNMVWLDIESHDLFYSSCSDNQWYIGEMLSEMSNILGKNRVGVYTNWTQWNDITCGWTGASSYQLWYPHYDNWASFGDFKNFGGWTSPNIKQFTGTTNICSTSIDKDFY